MLFRETRRTDGGKGFGDQEFSFGHVKSEVPVNCVCECQVVCWINAIWSL